MTKENKKEPKIEKVELGVRSPVMERKAQLCEMMLRLEVIQNQVNQLKTQVIDDINNKRQ